MRALALVILLVSAPVLAGCIGGSDGAGDGGDADAEPVSKARATVTSSQGGIEGVVTDTAVQPVPGANVTLVELDQTTRTGADGTYAFSKLQPGAYQLAVNAPGFVSAIQDVTVVAGDVVAVDFIIAHLFASEPFTQAWELAGFMECGFGLGYNLSLLPAPANVSGGIISYPICAEPNGIVGGNATNDRFDHFFDLEAPIGDLVVETTWDPSVGALSDQMWVDVVPEGFHCGNITTCDFSYLDHWGPSPLQGTVSREKFLEVQAYFERRCANGVDEWCGYSFPDAGWPLWIRTYVRWECQPAGAQGCVTVGQDFTHVVTAFYNSFAPDDFTALQ